MNIIFVALILIAFVTATIRQILWMGDGKAPMEALASGMISAGGDAVTLSIGLIGVMALFLGLMKVIEAGGALRLLSRLLRPLMVRLFPSVPADHPAMGAMILNLSANLLGLGNAATPFGIRAMQELDTLNPRKGTATDAQVLFLAINTSSITILPTTVIALRAAAGSTDPAGIVATTIFATVCATIIAIASSILLARLFPVGPGATDATATVEKPAASSFDATLTDTRAAPVWASVLTFGVLLALVPAMLVFGKAMTVWIVPAVATAFVLFGLVRRVPVYEAFVEGAKDAFDVAVRIIPYLVAILVAIGMFRTSGAMDLFIQPLGRVTETFGLPPEALSMAILRSLSGSGAYGYLASLLQDPAVGPDSYLGYLVSTIQGSSETTFYVLAVYFGAVGIRRMRHALAVGLIGDAAGAIMSVIACAVLFAL
ncbi:MAG: nucleoside recognition domain-containing protein [Alphaproteobacteria bacterium]